MKTPPLPVVQLRHLSDPLARHGVFRRAGWVLLLSLGTVLPAQPAARPEPPVITPNAEAVAYKKTIGRDPSTWQWNIPLALPHVTHGVVHSPSMGRDVGYNIHLPAGYADHPATRYPVVYYCHGATGSETSDTPVVEYVRSELKGGRIGPVIYVFVNAGHYSGYRDHPATRVLAETYLVRELIPEIDRRYRTLASRQGRALMGFSMGGGGATRLALKYPDLFCAAVSFGGALDPAPGTAEATDPDNLFHWATAHQDRLHGRLGLYFIVGGEDRMYARHVPFLAHLQQLKLPFHYRVIAGLGHNLWGSMARCAGDAIQFLDSQYESAREERTPAP